MRNRSAKALSSRTVTAQHRAITRDLAAPDGGYRDGADNQRFSRGPITGQQCTTNRSGGCFPMDEEHGAAGQGGPSQHRPYMHAHDRVWRVYGSLVVLQEQSPLRGDGTRACRGKLTCVSARVYGVRVFVCVGRGDEGVVFVCVCGVSQPAH
jgi:hypothetical protein